MAYIVFVPGIMGSELSVSGSKAIKWPVIQPHKVREITLEHTPQILNAEPIMSVGFGVFPVYRHIINKLETQYGSENVNRFGYDWRHGLEEKDTFIRLKDALIDKEDIIFVAHSMGGLLTKLFVYWCQENGHQDIVRKIKKVITIATPWRGTPDALIKLIYGFPHPHSTIPLTPPIIMKEVASNIPSVYQLLPHFKYLRENVGLVYDPETQRELRVDEVYSILEPKQKELLDNLKLHDLQGKISQDWPDGIQTFAIMGHEEATINYIFKAIRDQNGFKMIKERHEMASGDNTVPVSYAKPYDERTERRYLNATHKNIVRQPEVLNWVVAIINNQPELCSEFFTDTPSKDFSGKVIRVACPVDITIHKDNIFIGGEANNLVELKEQIDWLLSNYEDDEPSFDEEVFVVGDTTYIVSKETRDIELKIVGKKEGIASVDVQTYADGEITEISSYPALPVKEGSISSLRISADNEVSLTADDTPQEPVVVSVDNDRTTVRPVTQVSYELETGEEVNVDGKIIIQSPVKFRVRVSDISTNEYLETRIIANGKTGVFDDYEFVYVPDPGMNEIKIYSVSVYGAIDVEPYTFRFIYDSQAPVTKATLIMFPNRIQLFLKGEDDSNVNCDTFIKKSNDPDFGPYLDSISLDYNGGTVEYYSSDQVGHRERPVKTLRVPTDVFQNAVFQSQLTYNQLISLLGLDEGTFTIKSGTKEISNFETNIPRKTKSLHISTDYGLNYSIVYTEEFEVLWTMHTKEKIRVDDEELNEFRFQLISSHGYVTNDSLKVKVVPKGKPRDAVLIEFDYLPETMEYRGYFGLPKIPRNTTEGSVQILVGTKLYREAKFRVL